MTEVPLNTPQTEEGPMDEFLKVAAENGGANTTAGDLAQIDSQEWHDQRTAIEVARKKVIEQQKP